MGHEARDGRFDGGFRRSLTTFVGRRAESHRLEDLLGGYRLVTVTGPGGVGKTRLAAEVTRAQQHRFPDGIRLVELYTIRDPAQVPWAVAASLGVQDEPDQPITRSVATVLANERSLLVLDNCEHLTSAVAELCLVLLSDNDDTRILATSREPIGLDGEAQLRLSALPVAADPSGPDGADADGVALFLDRVRLREPALAVTNRILDQAAEIVARVDGLPLAIELAAARVEAMGMSHLLHRLDEPFQVLTSGAPTTVPRHRSLWATADWSYRLLTEQSRRTFRRLAILPGPFTVDTALAIAGRSAERTIMSLVEASIIAPPREGPDGRGRYLMLDSLRAYGHEQLEAAGELEDATAAMNAHAVLLAESIAERMQIAGSEASAASWFDAESALLHRALLSDLDGDRTRALRLGLALASWWRLRGLRSMGYPMLSRAADQVPDGRSPEQLAAQRWLGLLALGNSAWQTALRHFTTVRDAVERTTLSTEFVDALVGRATALRNLGRLDAAAEDAKRARELARALGHVQGEVLALVQLVLAANHNDDVTVVTQWHAQLREIETTRLADDVSRQLAMAEAVALICTGDLHGARLMCTRGLDSARAVRDITSQADLLYLSAHIALLCEDIDDAASSIAESLQVTARSGHRRRALDCLDHCAHVCAATDRWADAITVWAARSAQTAAVAMAERPQDIRRRRAALAQAHQRIGPAAARQAERRGSAMTFQAATEFAAILVTTRSAPSSRSGNQAGTGAGLTAREKELLALVADGSTDAQIAELLFISIRTVRSHLDRIRDKSGCRRRAELTRLALQHGLV